MKKLIVLLAMLLATIYVNAQGVGIGTTAPKAAFNVAENKTVLFGGDTSGAGAKMMWIPSKYAFRAGVIGDIPMFPSGNADGKIWDYDSIGIFSFATGYQNKATNLGASALGFRNIAEGDYSSVLGGYNKTKGNYSFAAGVGNQSLGAGSVTVGSSNIAEGVSAFASGYLNKVIGEYSFAAGYKNTTEGDLSVAFGNETTAKGLGSISLGWYNKANAAIGTTIGEGNISNSYGCFVTGLYNDSIKALSNNWVATDPIFIVGNGLSNTNRKNAIVIWKNGHTGFNTNAPEGQLHIKANTSATAPTLMLEEEGTDYSRINFKNTNPGYWRQEAITPVSGSDNDNARFNFYFSRFDYIMSLRGNGNAILTGTLYQNSDESLKKNIVPLKNTLEKLFKLNAYTYNWKDTARGNEEQLGLLAQEVETQFPQLVMTDNNGKKSVAYGNMVPVLLQSIKEQEAKIQALENTIAEIKTMLSKK